MLFLKTEKGPKRGQKENDYPILVNSGNYGIYFRWVIAHAYEWSLLIEVIVYYNQRKWYEECWYGALRWRSSPGRDVHYNNMN